MALMEKCRPRKAKTEKSKPLQYVLSENTHWGTVCVHIAVNPWSNPVHFHPAIVVSNFSYWPVNQCHVQERQQKHTRSLTLISRQKSKP